MRFHASVGILLLQGVSIVTSLCTCLVIVNNGRQNDIAAGKRCCKAKGDKLSGDLCNAVDFGTFSSCCDSQPASESVFRAGFDCTL
ncbi:hypothetical protein CKAH01_18010 [Colletotrichum kahawae]|uniref:Secreted protein n=1 Tax=Colletotrichum kahawae TaxID=34407 RepID=A0AAD9Y7W9_COLKA|nr:hypothetical protein CKAH01_18010 [Colletotrichum kahawae]